MITMPRPTFFEFFAGGGMARAGLGLEWECLFANDFDRMKVDTYIANWGAEHVLCEDVAKVSSSQLSGIPDLVWASFPCQDLSLAGDYRGLGNAASPVLTRSGTFWPFWSIVKALKKERRSPRMIVLENVCGAITSRGGKDFAAICAAISGLDYMFGAIVIDAIRFVPQSRQRVFFVAVESGFAIDQQLFSNSHSVEWHPRALVEAHKLLTPTAKRKWLWWNPPIPPRRNGNLADLIERMPSGVEWHKAQVTRDLLKMMTPLNRTKVTAAQASGERAIGCLYKRTRADKNGVKRQRAEVRFDDVAGCLRTPGGGSSRQSILIVDGKEVRSRLLSAREAARLMGLPDSYKIPARYNDAYHVAGDGVCVPVVTYLSKSLLEPLLASINSPIPLMAAC